jgi:beta-glucanase (GH16 family)
MKRKAIIFMALAVIAVFVIANTVSVDPNTNHLTSIPDNQSPNYTLIWEDDFNGNQIDGTKWSKCSRMPSAWARHMSSDDRLYRVKKGFIRLYCMRNTWLPNDTSPILTGGIDSKGKFEMGYGKLEVRARMTGAMGCWPAIWLARYSTRNSDPYDYAELDLVERYNHDNKVNHTVHTHYIDTQKMQKREEYIRGVDVNVGRWNVYAVEVLPDRIVFSVNDVTTFVYRKPNIPGIRGHWPFGRTKCRIIIDMQWGNRWLKIRRPQELPAYIDVDWVKAYSMD